VIYGVDMKIVDGDGKELPWDGKAFGDLYVRGPWVIDLLPQRQQPAGGWLVPHRRRGHDRRRRLHADHRPQQGRDQVRRRVDLVDRCRERRLRTRRAHGRLHLAPITRSGTSARCWWWSSARTWRSRARNCWFFEGKVAKWWIPDDVVFVTEIPLTATGKMQKLKLREQFKDYKLPVPDRPARSPQRRPFN
jgi:fatty-acyl-CoA synthase